MSVQRVNGYWVYTIRGMYNRVGETIFHEKNIILSITFNKHMHISMLNYTILVLFKKKEKSKELYCTVGTNSNYKWYRNLGHNLSVYVA